MALALALRLWGLTWGLPWSLHPDEKNPVEQATAMLESADLNPEYFKNPSLFVYVIAGELLLARALGPLAGPLAPSVLGSTYLLARLNSALIGTASVVLLYAIGANLFDRRTGLLAALFLAVSFIHVRNSHYGVNDVPAVGLLLLSLYFATRLLRRPSLRWYGLAGLAGGLATSTKYSTGFFFVPILIVHWLATRESDRRAWDRAGLIAIGAAAMSSLAGYLIGTPYTLLDFSTFRTEFLTQYRFGESRWLGQPADPVPWLYLTSLLHGFGVVPLALAMLGLMLLARRSSTTSHPAFPRGLLVLLAFPAAYLAFLLPKEVFFPRLILPLVPFFSVLAACGMIELARRFGPIGQSAGLAIVLVAALAQPLINDVRHNRLLLQANTRVLATEWVQANLPPGSSVKAEFRSILDPPTGDGAGPRDGRHLRVDHFEGRPAFNDAGNYAARNVQYFVTSSHAYERLLMDPPLRSQRATGLRYLELHRSLESEAELVASFTPGYGGRQVPYSQDEVFTPFWNLELYERPGPTIRIYSLEPLTGYRTPNR